MEGQTLIGAAYIVQHSMDNVACRIQALCHINLSIHEQNHVPTRLKKGFSSLVFLRNAC